MMDLVLKLRELRTLRGLSQKKAGRLSGVGEKTISSFETGRRIGSIKLEQLRALLALYGVTEAEFFGDGVERNVAPWELDQTAEAIPNALQQLFIDLTALPPESQARTLHLCSLLVAEVNQRARRVA